MRKYDKWFRADEGMIFVVTALGKAECATFRNKKVGEAKDNEDEATAWMVENGYVREVKDPNYVTLPGFKVVYDHKGYQISAGNGVIFHDREMAEYERDAFNNRPWNKNEHIAYIIDTTYKGKRPTPCREYKGKTVYNWSYWTYNRPVGSWVEEEIVWDLMDALPPNYMRDNCMQTSEPHDFKFDDKRNMWRDTYTTFKKVADGIYEYCGHCFKGENVERGRKQEYVA